MPSADGSRVFTSTGAHSSVSYSNALEMCSPSSPVLSKPPRNPIDRSNDNTGGGQLGVRGLLPCATLTLPPVEPTHKWLECNSWNFCRRRLQFECRHADLAPSPRSVASDRFQLVGDRLRLSVRRGCACFWRFLLCRARTIGGIQAPGTMRLWCVTSLPYSVASTKRSPISRRKRGGIFGCRRIRVVRCVRLRAF